MNINEDKNGLIWGKWKMNERTWVLTNRWCNFCYLLLGDEEAGQVLMVLNGTVSLLLELNMARLLLFIDK